MGFIKLGGTGQDCAPGGLAQAGGKGIAFAHGAQVLHQVGRVTITHRFGKAVGHRQGKACPLQQSAKIADFAHRQNPGRQAARHLGLGFGQTGAQFMQRLPAKEKSQKQAVRPQGAPALDKLANRVICPVQAQGVNDQIMIFGRQVQNIVIRHGLGQTSPDPGKRRDDHRRRKGSVNLSQSFLDLKADLFVQEEFGRAGAVAGKGRAVTKGGWRLHGAEHEGAMSGLQAVLHLVYPPQCICCDERVTSDFAMCGRCWRETPFLSGLVCDLCGTPLPGPDDGHPVHCDDCLRVARPWSRGRAVMLYRDRARDLVLNLKHADRIDLARPFGTWLHRTARPLLEPGMIVAPVPLYWMRLFRRRYNQAALLSAELARLAGLDHCPDLLRRQRNTGSQEGKSRDARFANLADAFALHPRTAGRVEGRHVLLVDDVMTSGATFAAAAEACLAGGATRISVLALARVAKDA